MPKEILEMHSEAKLIKRQGEVNAWDRSFSSIFVCCCLVVFKMPHSNGPKLVSTLWAMPAVSLVFLALRMYCKFLRGRGYNIDDIILALAFVSLHGLSKHIANYALNALRFF